MSQKLEIPTNADRATTYAELLPQLKALLSGENDLVANMANTAAAIHAGLGFHWVGFYLIKGEELVLGPFQGPIACTRIGKGKGVCGTAWAEARTMVVEDVELFPGHIACSTLSRSEVVVPMLDNSGIVIGVFDVDSDKVGDFDSTDKDALENIVEVLMQVSDA